MSEALQGKKKVLSFRHISINLDVSHICLMPRFLQYIFLYKLR